LALWDFAGKGALHIWDKPLEGFSWPAQQLPAQDTGDGYLARMQFIRVITSQLQGAIASDVYFSPFHRSVVFGEGDETGGFSTALTSLGNWRSRKSEMRFGEDSPNGLGVVLIHTGDDALGVVALGLEGLQEGASLSLAVVRVDVNVLGQFRWHIQCSRPIQRTQNSIGSAPRYSIP